MRFFELSKPDLRFVVIINFKKFVLDFRLCPLGKSGLGKMSTPEAEETLYRLILGHLYCFSLKLNLLNFKEIGVLFGLRFKALNQVADK